MRYAIHLQLRLSAKRIFTQLCNATLLIVVIDVVSVVDLQLIVFYCNLSVDGKQRHICLRAIMGHVVIGAGRDGL